VVDGRREPKIEIGRIDDDERVGTVRSSRVDQQPPRLEQPWDLGDRFGDAGDGEAAIIGQQFAACVCEMWSAEPGDGDVRFQSLQLAHQRAGVQVAGRFRAGEHQAKAQEGRLNRAASTGTLSLKSVIRRSIDCAPFFRAPEKANWTPSIAR